MRGEKFFTKIYQSGRKIYTPFLRLYWINNNLEFNRFGIVVSLKVSKRSTKRNLLKRRIRAIIKEEMPNLRQGFDILVITNYKTITLSYKELKDNLLKLFYQANLLK